MGLLGSRSSEEVKSAGEKDNSAGKDQTCIVESEDPVRMYDELGETAMQVTGCRCAGEVEMKRPVHVYHLILVFVQHISFSNAVTVPPIA